jgi:hypothetical protein
MGISQRSEKYMNKLSVTLNYGKNMALRALYKAQTKLIKITYK